MKRNRVFMIGLSLLLLSSLGIDGQWRSLKKSGVDEINPKLFLSENNRKVSEFNNFTGKTSKPARLPKRRRISNFSGRWQGVLYQVAGGTHTKFNFMMRLYQKGGRVSGYSLIKMIDSPEYYGVMRLRGRIKGNRLSFTEVKITRENLEPETRWCVKSGKLKKGSVKDRLRLTGSWQAPECSPGTIVLKKVSGK